MITITRVKSIAGDNYIVPGGLLKIEGTGLTAGNAYLLSEAGVVELTGLTWSTTSITGSVVSFTCPEAYDETNAQLVVTNAGGESAVFQLRLLSASNELTLHGWANDNRVTGIGTYDAPPLYAESYGSLGKITVAGSPTMTVQFLQFVLQLSGANKGSLAPVWSSATVVAKTSLSRLGAPVKRILQKQGSWSVPLVPG